MKDQYNKIVKTYKELGIKQILPTLAQIESALTPKQKALIKKHKAQLVITPAINEDFDFDDLLEKLNHWVYEPVWTQYDLFGPMKVSFVVPEPFYLNQDLASQRESLKKEQDLGCITPAEAVMWQILYKPQTLEDYWLRFIDLPNKTVGGLSIVGHVHSSGVRLYLHGSNGSACSYDGVGLSVGLNLNLPDSPLPSSFSSSDLQENTEATKELTEVLKKVFNL